MEVTESQRTKASNGPTAQDLIKEYAMQRHPAGGWFTENYRSNEQFSDLPERYGKDVSRSFATHIYYLMEDGDLDPFHSVKSDEIFHFYYGSDVSIYVIDHITGELSCHNLGRSENKFMAWIKHGDYFALKLRNPGKENFCFLGVTVMPGFDIQDYHQPNKEELVRLYPNLEKEISDFTLD